ncbi:O-acetyl-ADP-ribose deacetylase [Nocardiopsis coralliicola]
MEITLVRGDITEQDVDAVVNAANSALLGGGGVDGAIHRAGGPEILAECRALRAGRLRDGLPTGEAAATTAGRLPARWVVHTVGPVYSAREDRSAQLAAAYRNSLRTAAELGARTVAFPAVSAGVYGWPMDSAAEIAVGAVRAYAAEQERGGGPEGASGARDAPEPDPHSGAPGSLTEVRFVLFGADAYAAFAAALGRDR